MQGDLDKIKEKSKKSTYSIWEIDRTKT